MANQDGIVMGYPIQFPYHPTDFRTATTATTITTTTTSNSTAINTPTIRPFTPQNQPNTNRSTRPPTNTPTTRPFTPQNQPNTNRSTTPPTKRQICLVLFSFFCFALLVAVGIVLLIIYVKPSVNNPMFQVDSITVYPFNISSSHITANWDFSFTITNRDYDTFHYDDIWASVFYKETNISSTTVGSFIQDKDGNHTRLVKATIVASSVQVNNSVASAIVEDWSHGAVNFPVTVNAIAKIDPNTIQKQQKQMTVSCNDMEVDFSVNTTIGIMLGGPRKCRVSLHKLKK